MQTSEYQGKALKQLLSSVDQDLMCEASQIRAIAHGIPSMTLEQTNGVCTHERAMGVLTTMIPWALQDEKGMTCYGTYASEDESAH